MRTKVPALQSLRSTRRQRRWRASGFSKTPSRSRAISALQFSRAKYSRHMARLQELPRQSSLRDQKSTRRARRLFGPDRSEQELQRPPARPPPERRRSEDGDKNSSPILVRQPPALYPLLHSHGQEAGQTTRCRKRNL